MKKLLPMFTLSAFAFAACAPQVDLEAERVTWLHKGDFLFQHEPILLDNGNILLFDNNTRERGSRTHARQGGRRRCCHARGDSAGLG